MGVLANARAKDPRWLTTLSGSPPPPFDDGLDLPWCALCLRRENDNDDGENGLKDDMMLLINNDGDDYGTHEEDDDDDDRR